MGLFSRIRSGIGKVFRRVIDVGKKVLPVAAAVGALVFTAGAALGALPSWGAVAGSLGTLIGGSGTLGTVLAGALTHAGYGALAGGMVSSLLGGSFVKGAQMGALAGTVTGSVASLLAPPAPAGMVDPAAATKGVDEATRSSMAAATGQQVPETMGPVGAAAARAAPSAAQPQIATGAAVQQIATAPGSTLMEQVRAFWDAIKDSRVAAGLIEGVGTGLVALAGQDDGTAAIREKARQEQRAIGRAYTGTAETIAGLPGIVPVAVNLRRGLGRFVYDPVQGLIVPV